MSYFGTDGIRRQNGFFTQKFLCDVAKGISQLPSCRAVAVARDTRPSGVQMEKHLTSALILHGVNVISLGVVPSPCLALCATKLGCDYGIMLSASHNPPSYNGIKLFRGDGSKAVAEDERIVENYLSSPFFIPQKRASLTFADGKKIYQDSFPFLPDLSGMKILLDCAFGAASGFAEEVFRMLGATVTCVNDDLNSGDRINVGCGAEYAERLVPVSEGYDACFAFDGDSDRVKAVVKRRLLDGDHLMYCAAKAMKSQGRLSENEVCGTVMTNSGVEKAYKRNGIGLIRADVGDREVYRLMKENGLCLGGEKSGHVVFSDALRTGDGVMTAVIASALFNEYPLAELDDATDFPSATDELVASEDELDAFRAAVGKGIFREKNGVRIVVRASGTEPKIRFLAESEDENRAYETLQFVKKAVAEIIKR